MKRILVFAALLLALSVTPAAADYTLPAYLHDQVDYGISHYLKPSGCPKISAATYVQQIAAGIIGGPVTPEDTVWLNELARNIQDQIAHVPAEYPGVVFGAYCV